MKEVLNHTKHLEATFDRLITILFTEDEFDAITSMNKSDVPSLLSSKSSWIKTSDLAIEDITTEKMALIHLLWFQSRGRVVIEDIDPFSGAVLLHLNFKDIEKENEKELERMKRS